MRQHIEFDVDTDGKWKTGDWMQGLQRTAVPGRQGLSYFIPADAVITTVENPLRVGDMVDDTVVLDRAVGDTVIIDCDGDAWQRSLGSWLLACDYGREEDSADLLAAFGPVTVIHVPKNDG